MNEAVQDIIKRVQNNQVIFRVQTVRLLIAEIERLSAENERLQGQVTWLKEQNEAGWERNMGEDL